jgi:di/tricarboxylate transporter
MSKWILIGPVVGIILITTALIIGYVVVPPMIVQRIIEVRESANKLRSAFLPLVQLSFRLATCDSRNESLTTIVAYIRL